MSLLSIVICSRKPEVSQELCSNIKKTVGTDFELIVIDNSANTYSIFQAYNLGIRKSNGALICFIHDDIMFHSKNWGIILFNIFNDAPDVGLVGIAGSKVKSKVASAWWDCPKKDRVINILQHLKNGQMEKWHYGFDGAKTAEVVAIDGVFMALRREINIEFSADLSGFHNYDLNISFECIKAGYRIVVAENILLEHFSIGILNRAWVESVIKVHYRYKDILPLHLGQTMNGRNLEIENGKKIIEFLLNQGMIKDAWLFWLKIIKYVPISSYHFIFFKKFYQACLP